MAKRRASTRETDPSARGEAAPPIRTRRAAGALSIALTLVVLSPIVQNCRDEPVDDFPLSYFPMFSKRRGDELEVTHLVGVTKTGETRVVPLRWLGVRGLNAGRRQLKRAVGGGGAESACRHVAKGIAGSSDEDLRDVDRVRVVTGLYDYDRFFAGEIVANREVLHAECSVPR